MSKVVDMEKKVHDRSVTGSGHGMRRFFMLPVAKIP